MFFKRIFYKCRAHAVVGILTTLIAACGGGGGGDSSATSNASATTTISTGSVFSLAGSIISSDGVACAPTGATVTISGNVFYERVPFSAVLNNGLDYNNIQTLPIRAVDIQALGVADCVMASSVTDNAGAYTLNVEQNSAVKIRVKARTASTAGAIWDFEVRDNTRSNGLYVLDGSSVNSGASNSIRNLTAESGWTGASYGGVRAAAPFAILDSVYDSLQTVVAADAAVNMDDADIFWSINNSTASGTLSLGEIGGSFYSNDQLYILGSANSDTDEYDAHVVIHEWGHYFEDNLSRSDSVGGAHTLGDRLDFRVALSEGFGNAFSGIVTGDPIYRDSFGASQSNDFQINVETNASGADIGWFSEESVQTILYDIFDNVADANDGVNLGFTVIYDAMTSATYRLQSTFTSIFSLITQIKNDASVGAAVDAAIDTLVVSQGIDAIADFSGTGETNNGGDANNLPIYKAITDNGVPVQVCSDNANGEQNKLGNRQFLALSVLSSGAHNIVITRVSGLVTSDPDVGVYLNGALTAVGQSTVNGTETLATNLNVDDYLLEVLEFSNVDNSAGTGGAVCFNVTVS